MHGVGSLNFKVKFEYTPICPKFRWPDLIVLSVAKAMRGRRLVLVTFIFMHLLKKTLLNPARIINMALFVRERRTTMQ